MFSFCFFLDFVRACYLLNFCIYVSFISLSSCCFSSTFFVFCLFVYLFSFISYRKASPLTAFSDEKEVPESQVYIKTAVPCEYRLKSAPDYLSKNG